MIAQYLVADAVSRALAEDIGRGDITTDSLIDPQDRASALLAVREPGVLAGLPFAEAAFRSLDADIRFEARLTDGDRVTKGMVAARVSGSARALLTGERVALNFMTHLSGIASLTRLYVDAVAETNARIADTRKTLPGLRMPEKYAVRMGGGMNHRFGLDDAAMIKDNHIVAAGGIGPAIRRLRSRLGHMVRICCEVDRLEQIDEALDAGVDVILLDNMDAATLRQAVTHIGGRAITEASGGVSLQTVADIARSGVDVISIGRLTHSAASLDIGFDFEE